MSESEHNQGVPSETTKQFKLPCNPQTSSHLIRLPTELRLDILRNLLQTDHPILTQSTNPHGPLFDIEDLDLNVQLFRACQVLHREAHNILYGENTLAIWVKHLDFFGVPIQIPRFRTPSQVLAFPRTLAGYAESCLTDDYCLDRAASRLLECLPILSRFQRLQVDLTIDTTDWNLVMVLMLRDLLWNKHVLFCDYDTRPCEWNDGPARLNPFTLLRCRTVCFRYNPVRGNDIEAIGRVITSGEPVVDTFQEYVELLGEIKELGECAYGSCIDDWTLTTRLDCLASAALSFDVERMAAEVKLVREEMDEWEECLAKNVVDE